MLVVLVGKGIRLPRGLVHARPRARGIQVVFVDGCYCRRRFRLPRRPVRARPCARGMLVVFVDGCYYRRRFRLPRGLVHARPRARGIQVVFVDGCYCRRRFRLPRGMLVVFFDGCYYRRRFRLPRRLVHGRHYVLFQSLYIHTQALHLFSSTLGSVPSTLSVWYKHTTHSITEPGLCAASNTAPALATRASAHRERLCPAPLALPFVKANYRGRVWLGV